MIKEFVQQENKNGNAKSPNKIINNEKNMNTMSLVKKPLNENIVIIEENLSNINKKSVSANRTQNQNQ